MWSEQLDLLLFFARNDSSLTWHSIQGMNSPASSPTQRSTRMVTVRGCKESACAAPKRRQALIAAVTAPIAWVGYQYEGACANVSSRLGSDYDDYAEAYDVLDDGWVAHIFGIPTMRRRLLEYATGSVLEVGIGTGINLPLYDRSLVSSVTGVDLSQGMLKEAARRIDDNDLSEWAMLQRGDVTDLPFKDASFDTVVDSFSLCVYPQPAQALAEMSRMIRPNGRLLLLEHSRSNSPLLGWWQDVSAPAVAASGKGCYWNQDVSTLVQQAGFDVLLQHEFLAGTVRLVIAERISSR